MYGAKKGQSKYLHAIVMHEAKLNRMLGGEERTPVLLEAVDTTPGLLVTCLSFTACFYCLLPQHHVATSYGLSRISQPQTGRQEKM